MRETFSKLHFLGQRSLAVEAHTPLQLARVYSWLYKSKLVGMANGGAVDWLEALDIGLALKNCHDDLIGEWYRDPWSWPELAWVAKRRPDLLVARLNGVGIRMASPIDVAKENFGIRPALVMDPLDRLAYQALTDRMSLDLIRPLPSWVYNARLSRRTPTVGEY